MSYQLPEKSPTILCGKSAHGKSASNIWSISSADVFLKLFGAEHFFAGQPCSGISVEPIRSDHAWDILSAGLYSSYHKSSTRSINAI